MRTIFFLSFFLFISGNVFAGPCPQPKRISFGFDGSEANGASVIPYISGNGRYVIYESKATNITSDSVPVDTFQVYLYDRRANKNFLISKNAAGEAGNASSFTSDISPSGRYILFNSLATNLFQGDSNGVRDLFLYDLKKRKLFLLSTTSSGEQFNGTTYAGSVSNNGRYVLFSSMATNILPTEDSDTIRDVYLLDRKTGKFELISVNNNGEKGDDHSFVLNKGISGAKARYVVFRSASVNLSGIPSNSAILIYRRDRVKKVTELVSVKSDGTAADDDCGKEVISKNGRYIGFWCDGSLISADNNGITDSYLRDVKRGKTTFLTYGLGRQIPNSFTTFRDMTPSAKYISFVSDATNLGTGSVNDKAQVYIRKLRKRGKNILVSVNKNGEIGNDVSNWGMLSNSGKWIAFQSNATNLVDNDNNGVTDIFVAKIHFRRIKRCR